MNWAETILESLQERDRTEAAHHELIVHSHHLVQLARVLKERNAALMHATTTGHASVTKQGKTTSQVDVGTASANQAVQSAFIQSLEAQLAAMRRDLTEQYKIQATNAQRLLIMTDQLRQAEDRNRTDAEELRKVTNEVEGLRERAKWHQQVVAEKERQILILQDDHASLDLELHQLTLQNKDLKTDNASLLQRWIAAKTDEAQQMNAAFEAESARVKGKNKLKDKDKDRTIERASPSPKPPQSASSSIADLKAKAGKSPKDKA